MPKSSNQKLKLIYLMKILLERTDETHSITMPEMIDALAAYGISAERKSLYNDIENLRVYGLDIIGIQEDRTYSYHIGNRQFELAELKLLVDSVQSAKFITVKKSNELIKKIEGLASKYEASQLHRQVFVAGRVKTMNESIYYNVDRIHTAIAENSRITFQYFQWNVDKKIELRHDGALYEVSPWALSWDDENYYLIAYDSSERRKYDELFENCTLKDKRLQRADIRQMEHGHEIQKQRFVVEPVQKDEGGEETMLEERNITPFDGKENDWLSFARQQAEFYRNAGQYITNLQMDIREIDEEIEETLLEAEDTNCNVTQGYKVFKRLKELRLERKSKSMELDCLYALTDYIDCDALADTCEANLAEVEGLMGVSGQNEVANLQLADSEQEEKLHVVENIKDMVG